MQPELLTERLIGHASKDENGTFRGGRAGDQTGQEVCVRSWFSLPWKCVLRPQSFYAESIALAMEAACANDHIGYDQHNRLTLYAMARICRWHLDKIKVPCETDCSALVSVCVNCAGIRVPATMYTGNEKQILLETGKFTLLDEPAYLTSPALLLRGDILLGDGHTVIVL